MAYEQRRKQPPFLVLSKQRSKDPGTFGVLVGTVENSQSQQWVVRPQRLAINQRRSVFVDDVERGGLAVDIRFDDRDEERREVVSEQL